MFEDRTYENLLAEILENAPADIDTRQGSIFFDAVSGITNKIAKLYSDIGLIFGLTQIDTASGEYLDAKASEYGVTRHAAVPAKYYADISGTVPQSGERFFYNGKYFVFKQTENEEYYLEAEIPGNIPDLTGFPAVPVGNIPGLSSCKFGRIMEYGSDAEDDEGLRLRLKDKISTPGECGNKQHYKAWCESVDGVGTARIIPLWNGPNTVKGILINTEGLPCGSETVNRVQDYIDPGGTGLGEGAACIGSRFTAAAAKAFAVNIAVTLELQNEEDEDSIKPEIESAVRKYFKKLAVSGGDTVVRISEIGSEIGKISRIVDYSGLRINGEISNISVDFESVPTLGVTEIEILQ